MNVNLEEFNASLKDATLGLNFKLITVLIGTPLLYMKLFVACNAEKFYHITHMHTRTHNVHACNNYRSVWIVVNSLVTFCLL